jgi:hypothetical protein
MGGYLEGRVAKEGVDSGQAYIPAAHAQPSMLLEMIEKRHDQRRIDLLELQARRRRVQPLLRKRQEQPESIAIRTNRMRTNLTLLHQALREEPFQQRRKGWY